MSFWIVFLIRLFILACPVAAAVFFWNQITAEVDRFNRRWLWSWIIKGLAVPILVWVLLSLGTMPLMPPLTDGIARLRNSGLWGRALVAQTIVASIIIVWNWSAVTLAWLLTGLVQRARNYEDLIIAAVFWSPAALLIFGAFCALFGWMGIAVGAVLWLFPLGQYVLDKAIIKQPSPSYGRAIGNIKFGKYADAELAIIGELEKCENDFDGWMMLADLYATQFHDLDEAARAIHELCAEPTTTLSQVSIAYHRLADWYLKLRGDPVAARRALAEISTRMPGTHLDNMARHRMDQLAESSEEHARQQQPRTVHMPALSESLGDPTSADATPVNHAEALACADQCVEKLKQDPNDVPIREELARLFAEQLQQPGLAIEQIELLMDMPEQPPEKLAAWLGLLAAWQIKYRGDVEAARKLLQKLIREFPNSPQAFAAQRRLSLMEMESRTAR